MHDFSCTNPEDMKYKLLAERTRYFKQDEKGVTNMCMAMEELITEDRIEIAEKMLEGGKLSPEDIALYSRLPLEKVKELSERIHHQDVTETEV